MKTYTIIVEEDPDTGECVLPLPDELIAELGWLVGDELNCEIEDEDVIITNLSWLSRKESTTD
jgi:hypothetical protein